MTWSLEPHGCRTCGGRVLRDGLAFRCATCGAHCTDSPFAICHCGTFTGPRGKGARPARGPFRCVQNPARSFASPAEIVALYAGSEASEVPLPLPIAAAAP